jgi:uncharacterized integral membrane protein
MYLRTLLILIVLGAVAAFTAVNWQAFATPTMLSLIFGTVEAPLGLVLLGIVALLTVMFLLYIVYLQSSVLFEGRRHARDLQAQRDLADQAEASRFIQLQTFLENELPKLIDKNEASKAELLTRLDQLARELRSASEQSVNTIAAYLGELDDRFKRATGESTKTEV